ncbi:MAG: sigma-54-dependent Fis family transcriptional regulator [Deltaproteobacteria bacterium]|nr:sigma-54-dependent Fis family transcriptional regulator [Deltaproteobacteria bacterium]
MSVSILNLGQRRLVVADERMGEVIQLAKRAAATLSPVMLCGESGSGKELIARFIHAESSRSKGPFVSINCAAVPDGLMESELFGHERGAFTGAVAQHLGKFERATQGTLLLDEVSEMSVHLQAKLLRVLQEGELDRLGGRDTVPINCRIVSTTNRDPKISISESLFREDLFYRLNVIRIDCPSLRGRETAIEALATEFLQQASLRQNKAIRGYSAEAMKSLKLHDWPGNIRELQNVVERAVLLCDGALIKEVQLDDWIKRPDSFDLLDSPHRLDDVEKKHILQMLKTTRGNRTLAASELGISVRTLRNKLKVYQLS